MSDLPDPNGGPWDPPQRVVTDLASSLAPGDLRKLAGAAALGMPGMVDLRAAASHRAMRVACDRIMEAWRQEPGRLTDWVAGLLVGASLPSRSGNLPPETVWTGPASDVDTTRLTAPTVLDLIDSARRAVWLVS